MPDVIPQHQVTPELTAHHGALAALIAEQIHTVLPHAQVEHVGATAVPGLTTKGDLDIAVHVPQSDFNQATFHMGKLFRPIHEAHWRPGVHHIFEAPSQDGTEISLQLVAEGSTHDFFVELKMRLLKHEKFRQLVNEVKAAHATSGVEVYRQRKAEVYDRILAWRGSQQLDWYDFEAWTRPPSGTWVVGQVRRVDQSVVFVAGCYEEADDIVRDACGQAWSWDTPDQVQQWAALNHKV